VVRDKPTAILDAALSLVGERSAGATTVPAIAERAGVAVGTLYRYWPSKEALVNALYQRWKGAFAAALAPAAGATGDARTVFAAWFRAVWDFAAAHPEAFAFLETHHHAAYLDETSRALDARVTEAARAFAERAQRGGEIAGDDPELLIALVLGAVVGVHRAANQGRLALSARVRDATEARVWAMLAAPAPPPPVAPQSHPRSGPPPAGRSHDDRSHDEGTVADGPPVHQTARRTQEGRR
jgi:AcrR family transcriptional regulator